MAEPLADRHPVEYPRGTPALPAGRAEELLEQLHGGWQVGETQGHPSLTKTFKYQGYMPGVELIDRIAELAESESHHPDLHLTYGSLRVDFWTHTVGGLSENDFIMAAKIDQIRPS
jgi:4a-hydroxytetrahydrobiopterin dehydratase